MKILDYFKKKQPEKTHSEILKESLSEISNTGRESTFYGSEYYIFEEGYDGEKTTGYLGAPKIYEIYHESLSARAWQLYLESDITKMFIEAYKKWVLGSGLRLESEPAIDVIKNYFPKFDNSNFVLQAESRIRIWLKSKNSSHSGMDNAHSNCEKVIVSALVGGDCVVIYRVEKGGITTEIIDSRHIKSPYGIEFKDKNIVNGVELGENKEHLAYGIQGKDFKFKRIECIDKKTGRLKAKMIYGSKYRIDGVRGMPWFAQSIEKLQNLESVVSEVIAGTLERSKIAYFTETNHMGVNEDIFAEGVEASLNGVDKIKPPTVSFDETQKIIKKTTGKTAAMLPNGMTLKSLEGTIQLNIGDFLKDVLVYVSASMCIPYEVVVMMYTNSFSASRMATQSFQHILNVERDSGICGEYYKPIYEQMLELEILKGKIQADGYFTSLFDIKDPILIDAYKQCRFTGVNVPSADPSKEVKAEILKLGNNLTTYSKATEATGGGDAFANFQRLKEEKEAIKKLIPKEKEEKEEKETKL